MKIRLVLVMLIVSLYGCANVTTSINQDATPNMESAYLAGSFLHSYRESFGRLALKVEDTSTNNEFYIELQQPRSFKEIDIIPVSPGVYRVSKLAMLGGLIGVEDVSDVRQPRLNKPFKAESGHIYYLGSFDGRSTNKTSSVLSGSTIVLKANRSYNLDVYSVRNEKIFELIKKNYPNFSDLKFVNIFIMD